MNFTTVSLPALVVGAAQNFQLAVTGATHAVTYVVNAGALPQGLSLSANGVLAGTPTTNGPYAFSVTATDTTGATAVQPFAGNVLDNPNNRLDDLITVTAASINALNTQIVSNAAQAANSAATLQAEIAQLQATAAGNGNLVDEDFARNFVSKLSAGPHASAATAALALTGSANG